MAEYESARLTFDASGIGLVAISTDSVSRSAALREKLQLGFPVLSDVERRVAQAWGILDSRHFGGVAVPATFLVDGAMQVRFASVDARTERVSPAALLAWQRSETTADRSAAGARRRVRMRPGDIWRAWQLWRRK